MKRGAVIIAHNTEQTDYYKMATHTAKRINEYLELPVTIITDATSVESDSSGYVFDSTILVQPDTNNYRKKSVWINKGRYQVYQFSPYDDTLVLDSDYVINSQQLLKTFDYHSDFVCHKNVRWLMRGSDSQEYLHTSTVQSLWATVMRFTRTSKVEQIFNMMQMIETNYEHYANIYKFMSYSYRNDYALTIALNTVNGHLVRNDHYLHWNLLHVSNNIKVLRETETQYILLDSSGKKKNSYMRIKDIDFHMLSKYNYMELFK